MGMTSTRRRKRRPLRAELKRRVEAAYLNCFYCGRAPDPRWQTFPPPRLLEVDHVTPLMYGGRDTFDNLVMACSYCNRAKRDMPMNDFIRHLQRVWARWGWGI